MKGLCRYLLGLCLVAFLPRCYSTGDAQPLVNSSETNLSFLRDLRFVQASDYIHTSQKWCVTYDEKSDSTVVAKSPYCNDAKLAECSTVLPKEGSRLNEAVCGKTNREGLLCSRCKPGYGPAVLSYGHKCAPCSGSFGWFLYLCAALIPTTVFFIVIVVCQVRTTSAPWNFFIFGCQIIAMFIIESPGPSVNQIHTFNPFGGIVATFFTMWTLEFFRILIPPFCVSENLSNMQVLCMDYIVAFYPLLLTVVMYVCIQQHARGCRVLVCLWKPFSYCFSPLVRKFNWNPATSIVHIFASFLLLSSTKILIVSISLLQTMEITASSNGTGITQFTNMLYDDPHLTLFSPHHLPYAILAILLSTTFVILPCLLLIVYPTRLFQKCLNCCGIRWHALHSFADAFNGCYKNGTNGTRDYRCFAGFYLLLRVLSCVIFAGKIHASESFIPKLIVIFTLMVFALFSPYKNKLFNFLDSFGIIGFLTCVLALAGHKRLLHKTERLLLHNARTIVGLHVYYLPIAAIPYSANLYHVISILGWTCTQMTNVYALYLEKRECMHDLNAGQS